MAPHNGRPSGPATATTAPQQSRKQWIRMAKRNDRSLPSLPSEAYGKERKGSYEFEGAIEGKPVDVEEGL